MVQSLGMNCVFVPQKAGFSDVSLYGITTYLLDCPT